MSADFQNDNKKIKESTKLPNASWYIEHIKSAFIFMRLLPMILIFMIGTVIGSWLNCRNDYERGIKNNEHRLYDK